MTALADDLAAGLDPVVFARRLGFVAEPWQERLLRSTARRLLVTCARQVGKSTCAALKVLHLATYEPGSLCLIFSAFQRQSDELLKKVRSFAKALEGGPPERDSGSEVVLANGSRIVALPGLESSTRGFSAARLLILDEAAYASDGLLAAALPMVASTGQFMVMSTPNGRQGFFYALHEDGANGYERHKITAYESAQYNAARIAEVKASLGSFTFSSDYECSFTDTDTQLFGSALVRAAFAPIETLEI